MTRNIILMFIIVSLFGCSSVKIEKDYLVHEDLYRVPIIKNDAWFRMIPANPFDAVYMRCPNEQLIIILNSMFCKKYDYSKMTDDDYAKRLYLNEYFSFLEGFVCSDRRVSPLTDNNFKKLIGPVSVDKDKKQITIQYESSTEQLLCGLSEGKHPVNIMDILIEDPKERFINGSVNGPHTRFVVFRYMSSIDRYESGIKEFKDLVSKFQWLE